MYHFYCFNQEKIILVSDLPVDKIKKKYGIRYEILTSIKERDSIVIIKERLKRSYSQFEFIEAFTKAKHTLTDEQRQKISASKLGKPRDEATRAKISAGLKGRSNFQGKQHSPETRARMAEKKLGNDHAKDLHWAHDPRSDTEVRVKEIKDIPQGYSKGRDYYSTEPGLYHFKQFSINRRRG